MCFLRSMMSFRVQMIYSICLKTKILFEMNSNIEITPKIDIGPIKTSRSGNYRVCHVSG